MEVAENNSGTGVTKSATAQSESSHEVIIFVCFSLINKFLFSNSIIQNRNTKLLFFFFYGLGFIKICKKKSKKFKKKSIR